MQTLTDGELRWSIEKVNLFVENLAARKKNIDSRDLGWLSQDNYAQGIHNIIRYLRDKELLQEPMCKWCLKSDKDISRWFQTNLGDLVMDLNTLNHLARNDFNSVDYFARVPSDKYCSFSAIMERYQGDKCLVCNGLATSKNSIFWIKHQVELDIAVKQLRLLLDFPKRRDAGVSEVPKEERFSTFLKAEGKKERWHLIKRIFGIAR